MSKSVQFSMSWFMPVSTGLWKHGVTENLLKMVEDSLNAHELIKVKFNEYKDDKREYSEDIANRTDSNLVRVIGNVAIFYRQNEDPEKRLISLK